MDLEAILAGAVREYIGGRLALESLDDLAAQHITELPALDASSGAYRLMMAIQHGIALLDDGAITQREFKQMLAGSLPEAAPDALDRKSAPV